MKHSFEKIVRSLSFTFLILFVFFLNLQKAVAIDNSLIQKKSIELETQIPDTEIPDTKIAINNNKKINLDDVKNFINTWKTSWEQQNFESYINLYSLNFKNNSGQNFEQWKTYRKPRVTNKDKIEIKLTNLKITEISNGFEANFTQEYKSGTIDANANKKLIIETEDNQLKIISEDSTALGEKQNRTNQAKLDNKKVTKAPDLNQESIFQELAQSETTNSSTNSQDSELEKPATEISQNIFDEEVDPYEDEIPLSPSRMIELPNINIADVESLIEDIVFELKTKKKYTVLSLSLDSQVPEVDSVDFYSHVSRTYKEGTVMNIFLGYMKRPRRTPQLCIYSTKTENGETSSNTAYTNKFIDNIVSSVFEKTQEFESSLSIKDLDFKLVNLSYVDPDGALFGLKAMGYSVITDDAALWADNDFQGKLDIEKVTKALNSNQDNIFQDLVPSQTSNPPQTASSLKDTNQQSADVDLTPDAISFLPSSIKASRLPIIVKMPSPDAKSTGLVGGNTLNKYLTNNSSTSSTDYDTTDTTSSTSTQLTSPPTPDLPIPVAGQVSSQLLVIYNPNDKKALSRVNKAIFELIDKPAKQILIEGMVLEMSSTELSKLGVKWSTSRANGSVISLGSLAEITSVASGSGAANLALTNTGVGLGKSTFTANLEALITKTKSQVLSKPSLLTLDNRQASIKVGTNIPIAASVTTAVGASTAGFTYLPVGIMLNIRPRISDDNNEISMLIDATVSQKVVNEDVIIYNSTGNAMASAPTTTLRKIQTYARVENEEPLIIAGLMSKEKTMSKSGVPLLSNIPLLGNLFSYQSPSEQDTEIVLIITPTIIESEKNTIKANLDDEFLKSKLLFRNNYRITNADISGMDGMINNNVYRNFQEKINLLEKKNPELFQQEPFMKWSQGKVPGENNFVAGKIAEIEKKLNFSEDVNLDNLIFTRKNDAGLLEKVNLTSVLESFVDLKNNKTFFQSISNKALLITFESSNDAGNNLLDSMVSNMTLVDCVDRNDWNTLLWDRNFLSPHSSKTIVIQSPEDLLTLKKAVVTNAIVNENGGFKELSMRKFKAGRLISLPKDIEDKKIMVDFNVANMYSNTNFFLNNFYSNLDEQIKITEIALEGLELNK